MSLWWLTYNPSSSRAMPVEELKGLVRDFELDPKSASKWWRFASHTRGRIGDKVYLFKQGRGPRGIFGVGEIIEGPELRAELAREGGEPRWGVLVSFENIVDPDDDFLLPLDEMVMVPKGIINSESSGIHVPDDVASHLETRLASCLPRSRPSIAADEADNPTFDPESTRNEHERAIRAVRIRRGQPQFRESLLNAYGGRCAVTGCPITDVLEAAHISPYAGEHTNTINNGLLLRADIHTLFDCNLLAIHPTTREIVISSELEGSTYAKLAGRKIRQPTQPEFGPNGRHLRTRFADFQASRRATSPRNERTEPLERMRTFQGRLPPDFKFDRDEANAR